MSHMPSRSNRHFGKPTSAKDWLCVLVGREGFRTTQTQLPRSDWPNRTASLAAGHGARERAVVQGRRTLLAAEKAPATGASWGLGLTGPRLPEGVAVEG